MLDKIDLGNEKNFRPIFLIILFIIQFFLIYYLLVYNISYLIKTNDFGYLNSLIGLFKIWPMTVIIVFFFFLIVKLLQPINLNTNRRDYILKHKMVQMELKTIKEMKELKINPNLDKFSDSLKEFSKKKTR